MKYVGTFNLALVTIASLLLPILDARAQEKIIEPKKLTNNLTNIPTLSLQEQVCPSSKLLPKRSFETAKYRVYICRGEKAGSLGYYVRISKSDGGKTTIPVTQVNGETYVAIKEELAHVITPYELIAVKQGRLILKERVKSAFKGDGQALTKNCPPGQNTLVEAETTGFLVYICGKEVPDSYISIAKNGNSAIALPLQKDNSQSGENTQYLAINGNVHYILNRNVFRVIEDGRTIVKEKVINWN
uniref:Uncharacterized protein n=1 Tax=Tolypothrix bouteillei VB521301 TaxID=1479485 RepID=A0A0C1NFG4_9CYAN